MSVYSYGRALARTASRQPDAIALHYEGEATTYRRLEENSNRLARAYAELGVGEGDFVTISLPNGREIVESFFACWKLGATPQPVSARLPDAERDAIVELADPSLVVGVAEGSYGKTSAGTERAPATQACKPQSLGTCP